MDISPHPGAIFLTNYSHHATGTMAYYLDSTWCLEPSANDCYTSTLQYHHILSIRLSAIRPKHTYIALLPVPPFFPTYTAMSPFQWYQILLGINTTQQMQYLQTMWPQHATLNSEHNQYDSSTADPYWNPILSDPPNIRHSHHGHDTAMTTLPSYPPSPGPTTN